MSEKPNEKTEKEKQWEEAESFIINLEKESQEHINKAKENNLILKGKLERGEIPEALENPDDFIIENHDNYMYEIGIDSGLHEILVALRAYGFETWESCSGHPEKIKGSYEEAIEYWSSGEVKTYDQKNYPAMPFIGIDFKEDQLNMLRQLIQEFYSDRNNTTKEIRLTTEGSRYGGKPVGLTNVGYFDKEFLKSLTQEELRNIVIAYQKERDDFAEFLKNRSSSS